MNYVSENQQNTSPIFRRDAIESFRHDNDFEDDNLDQVAREASEIEERNENADAAQRHLFHTDDENYVQEDYSRFINPWRKHAMETSFLTEDDHIERLPSKNIFTATGLKRENIYEKRKTEEKPNKGKTLHIRVKSVGCFDPPFHGNNCDETVGLITIDGTDVSENKPGFNIVVLDLKSGEREQSVNFNTHGEAGEYEKLEEFLSSLEMWKVICIAVKNDANNYLPSSALQSFSKIGASEIVRDEIEYRSSYAFVGITGPEKARAKLDWIREENSKAGEGPSIISVAIQTGEEAFKAAGGKMNKRPRSHLENADDKKSTHDSRENQHNDADASDEVIKQGIMKNEDPSPVYDLKNTLHEAKNILSENRKDISKFRESSDDDNKSKESNSSNSSKDEQTSQNKNTKRHSENSIPETETKLTNGGKANISVPKTGSVKEDKESPSTANSTSSEEKALLENKLRIEQMVSKIMNSRKEDNTTQATAAIEQKTLDTPPQQETRTIVKNENVQAPPVETGPGNMDIAKFQQSSLVTNPLDSNSNILQQASLIQNPAPTLDFQPTEKFLSSNPTNNIFEAARKIGLDGNIPGDSANPLKQIYPANSQPVGTADLIQSFIRHTMTLNNDTDLLDSRSQTKVPLPSPKELLANTIANLKEENKLVLGETVNQPGNILENAYASTGTPVPSSSGATTESRSSSNDGETRTMPIEVPANADPRVSTMETAAELAGSRNVGESRLASALSSLGIPDAGATGIASLMASGFVAAGSNNKKDAALKLGLAAKLAKSIADLGGRGAASAAGIASLNELLKDGREMSTSRLADQIGQALQRVGGAGAAVGYSALAAALKAIGGTRSPGALVGGVILALAEQGSAPGTAGLAALAAGLGGSGADALASGLGGSLPSMVVAKTSNFVATPGETRETPATAEVGVLPRPAAGTTPVLADTFVQQPPSISSGLQYHPGNIETEYTGQGPIGSVSQGNFANAAKLLPNKFLNPEPVAVLSTNGDHVDMAKPAHTGAVVQPETGVIPASRPVQVGDHAHAAAQPLVEARPVAPVTPVATEPVVSPDLLNTLIAKLTESLKAKSPVADTVATVPDSVEGSPAHQATITQTSITAPAPLERKVDLNEVLSSAMGHKEGVSIPELLTELQHPVSSNTEAAVSLVNQLGTHLSSDLRQTPCCNGRVSGELTNVNKIMPPAPAPSLVPTTTMECGIPMDKNTKRCLTKCTERKELYGRLVDLESSGTKAVIKINGEDWSKDDNGFNIVVLDFVTGEVEATENFDTEIDGGASKAMANFIKSLHPGKVILGATKGRAGELLNDEAYRILKEAGAKKISEKHLEKGAKYVFIGYKGGDRVPWEKESLNDGNTDTSATLIEPIVVGPGALKNSCVCLQSCNEAENKKIATAKTAKQPEAEMNSEKAYADMGDMPIAPGSAGTKRMVGKQAKHNTQIKVGKDISLEEVKNLLSEASGDEEPKVDEETIESVLLAPLRIKSQKSRKKLKEKSKQSESYDKTNNNNPDEMKTSKVKLSILSKSSKKQHEKLLLLQKKLNKLKHKNHEKKSKSLHKTNNIIDILSQVHLLPDNSKENRGNSKPIDSEIRHIRPLKEEALSLVNGLTNHNRIKKKHEKHKLEEKFHQEMTKPEEAKVKQNITMPTINYDDVYSTIGNNLHSRKKSERPRPEDNLR